MSLFGFPVVMTVETLLSFVVAGVALSVVLFCIGLNWLSGKIKGDDKDAS